VERLALIFPRNVNHLRAIPDSMTDQDCTYGGQSISIGGNEAENRKHQMHYDDFSSRENPVYKGLLIVQPSRPDR
jgi:hypothetical protein